MKNFYTILFFLILFYAAAQTQIINVPLDQPTIQAGIDMPQTHPFKITEV